VIVVAVGVILFSLTLSGLRSCFVTKTMPLCADGEWYANMLGFEVTLILVGISSIGIGLFSVLDSNRRLERIEKAAIKFAKGRVLDVGCGAGRVAIYLQNEKKLDVLGIDNSPLAIKVSKLRGLKKAKLLDFRKINFPSTLFDTIVMFGNNGGNLQFL
jgi:SAM-dependent methyltransferase